VEIGEGAIEGGGSVSIVTDDGYGVMAEVVVGLTEDGIGQDFVWEENRREGRGEREKTKIRIVLYFVISHKNCSRGGIN
jgi:hypothetical protein